MQMTVPARKKHHEQSFEQSKKLQLLAISSAGLSAKALAAAACHIHDLSSTVSVCEQLAKKQEYGHSISPDQLITQSNAQCYNTDRLIARAMTDAPQLRGAAHQLERSMCCAIQAVNLPDKAKALLIEARDACLTALNIFNHHADPVWIGGYYKAASQFLFIMQQMIATEQDPDLKQQTIDYTIDQVERFSNYIDYAEVELAYSALMQPEVSLYWEKIKQRLVTQKKHCH